MIDNDDHRTPKDLFRNLSDRFGGFDLDVAANDKNYLCLRYFTKERSGLKRNWIGENVWCNPPYSNLKKWVEKAIKEIDKMSCKKIVMLIPVDTSAVVWGRYIYDRASEIYFINKRLKFEGDQECHDENYSSPRSSAIVVFNSCKTQGGASRRFQYMTSKGIVLYPSQTLGDFTVSNRV